MNRRYIGRILALLIPLIPQSAILAQTSVDLYPIIKNDKLGFINHEGREVIPPQFSHAGDTARFREGLANVSGAGGWAYIDRWGKFVVEPQFWWT